MGTRNHGGGAADLVASIYERLQELIVHGRLAPGSRIIESELASRLGVSRTPVRSALQRLQQEGLVVSADGGKNARLSVAPLTRDDGRELLNILGALEGLGAAWAAELEVDVRRSLAEEMRRINESIRSLLEQGDPDPERVFLFHTRFHRLPMERVESPRLVAMHAAIRPQVDRYRRIYVSSVTTRVFGAELVEHEPIITALERGDPEGARVATQANWSAAAGRLERIIAAVGDRGSW